MSDQTNAIRTQLDAIDASEAATAKTLADTVAQNTALQKKNYDLGVQVAMLQDQINKLTNPPVTSKVSFGPIFSQNGLPDIANFVTKTVAPQNIRTYPAGKVTAASGSLNQTRKAITTYPGADIVFNALFTDALYVSKTMTQAQLIVELQAIEVEAAKVPNFWLVPDAEPDRFGAHPRTYTVAQFCQMFALVASLLPKYAPHVKLSLNLTGSDFKNRIALFDAIKGNYAVLSLDPYWLVQTGGEQGSDTDLADALVWCKANNKQLALAEWGVEGLRPPTYTDPKVQVANLNKAMAWIKTNRPVFSCLFFTPGVWDCTPASPEFYTAYVAGVKAANG